MTDYLLPKPRAAFSLGDVEFSLYSLASHGADRFHDLPVKMPTGMG